MEDITEKPKELAQEAERGRSARTPWLVLGGVNLVVALVVAIVLAIATTAHYLS